MLMMQEKHGYIRSIDVAALLGMTKPGASYAAKRLREAGYITMDGGQLYHADRYRHGNCPAHI